MAEDPVPDSEQAGQPGGLSVVTTATDGIRVLRLAGEIGHRACEHLQQALTALAADRPRMVVDLRRVTFMDSSGINILVNCYPDLRQALAPDRSHLPLAPERREGRDPTWPVRTRIHGDLDG
ncbi:STAS domain-containing protein [Streptomyces sp. NPDC050388]|uniref:STAS domain-containing protein n=1 Tax=Streptomyces sp. NPDC050388 TaxID=3155781 RepID=UPI00343792E0